MVTLRTTNNPLSALEQNDSEYCIKIKYENDKQLKESLARELQLGTGKEIIDLVIIISEARAAEQEIGHLFRNSGLCERLQLRIDGSLKYVRKSGLNKLIASRMESMLMGKLVAKDLMTQRQHEQYVYLNPDLKLALHKSIQHEIPEAPHFFPYIPMSIDGGLNSKLSVLTGNLVGGTFKDFQYPSLVIEVGDSQSTSELLFKSLLHLRAQAMPTDTVLTADFQIGVQDDEITISKFNLHHFDFSIENLRSILRGLPDNKSADNLRKRESLEWAISLKCRRVRAQLDCLSILVEETMLLDQVHENVETKQGLKLAQEATLLRMDARITALIQTIYPSIPSSCRLFHTLNDDKFLGDWLSLYHIIQQTIGSIGDHGTIVNRIEEVRRYYLEAQLEAVDLTHNDHSEVAATEQVIALVIDTHGTHSLHTPEKIRNGFRIPVSSIQIIPTGQDWIDVTSADLQELYMTAMSYIEEKMEASVANMIVHKKGVKHQYRSQFLEMARGNSTTHTFEELFSGNNYIDTPIRIGFVSTNNIVAYIRAQGIPLNPTTNRVIAVSKLLELSAEETQVRFLLRPHTMDYIHSHRRSEAAMDILNSLGQGWNQDPWESLQEFVCRQGQLTTQLALKYFTNAGLIELIWTYSGRGFGAKISDLRTREKRIRRLSQSLRYPLPSDWQIQPPKWIDNIIFNVRVLDWVFTRNLIRPATVVSLLKQVSDPELQRKVTEAAFADPGSFAVVLQISRDVDDFLAELNVAFPNLGICSF